MSLITDMFPSDSLCDGFDRHSGQRWIYPNNMTIRGYQKQAVEKALFTNAMIVLPTGFGKTFIAAVVMYNFYRWYPEGKIIFVAPTKPLVHQQIAECKKISGIPSSDCIEITGVVNREKRIGQWKLKRVFFATPQVIENDLQDGSLPPKQVKCLVIDEAHRAQGGYAYVGIVRQLHEMNRNGFRILALSATPGSDIQRVQQVMMNLYIGDVMFRSENSIDLMQFKNEKMSKAWTVELVGKHKEFVDRFIRITSKIYQELHAAGLTYSGNSIDTVARYVLVRAGKTIGQHDGNLRGKSKGRLRYLLFAAASLSYSFELLTQYGIRIFYTSIMRSITDGKLKAILAGSTEFDILMKDIKDMFGEWVEPDLDKAAQVDLLRGHPKLVVVKDMLLDHFNKNAEKQETRAIVFTKFRESVYDIVQALKTYDPILKPGAFRGQGSGAKKSGNSGMKQKEQMQMVSDFKAGKYNVLVATCVAEEGLDIGEVDLIICYDTSSSPISNTQRRGRTGRKRTGNVQIILTKGYEEKSFKKASSSKRQVEDQLFNRENYMMHRYREAPRMVPMDVKPVCLEQKIFPVDDDVEERAEKPKRKRRKSAPKVTPTDDLKKSKKKETEVFMVDMEDTGDTEVVEVSEISEVRALKEQEDDLKAAKSDSDVDWGSDLEFNCV